MIGSVADFPFDRYVRYEELTQLLNDCATQHPDLVTIESIGQSHEGREIWLVTVTDSATGPADEKPAFWCDGNIHASEVSATSAVLKILSNLVNERPAILQERAFYLVPRLCPDGAEWALADVPKLIRSSTRPYPYDVEDPYGLEKEDVDGDGRILNIRVPDPNGPWTISDLNPRLMRRRKPGENTGPNYRILPEGTFKNFDGLTMRATQAKEGLDLNRNFPSAWRPEYQQMGAGDFPTSEPEVRAAVSAIVNRPNICGAITFHTYSGVLLRPPSRMPDTDIPAEDLWTYQAIGAVGKEMTGYPDISNYHEFRYHPKQVITGVFDDWAYEHRGIHAWTVEIWAPVREAGITDYKYIDWFRDHPHEDDVKMLEWSDRDLEGKGYIDWYPFDHPQLGPVEIGGWDAFYAFRNPPPPLLDKEITPLADWAIWHAGTGPRLGLRAVLTEPIGDAWRIRFAVQNEGWLPTNVTQYGQERKLCRGVRGTISRPDGEENWLRSGRLNPESPQLKGYSHVTAGGWGYSVDATDDVAVFEWIVTPGFYQLEARHDRAGTVRTEISVG
jgi:murein tripeptide amidase MpaA